MVEKMSGRAGWNQWLSGRACSPFWAFLFSFVSASTFRGEAPPAGDGAPYPWMLLPSLEDDGEHGLPCHGRISPEQYGLRGRS